MFDSIIARQNAQVTPKSMGAHKRTLIADKTVALDIPSFIVQRAATAQIMDRTGTQNTFSYGFLKTASVYAAIIRSPVFLCEESAPAFAVLLRNAPYQAPLILRKTGVVAEAERRLIVKVTAEVVAEIINV